MQRGFDGAGERLAAVGRRHAEGEMLVRVEVEGQRQRRPRLDRLRHAGEHRPGFDAVAGPERDADRPAGGHEAMAGRRTEVAGERQGLSAGDDRVQSAVGLQAEAVAGHRGEQAPAVEVEQGGVVSRAAGHRDLHVERVGETMDQELPEVPLERADHQGVEGAAADGEQEADLPGLEPGAFQGVGDRGEDRAAQRVFVFVGLERFVVEERLHQFREAEPVERRRAELQQRPVGQLERLDARVGLDRIGQRFRQVDAVGAAMFEQFAEPGLQLLRRREQLRFELLLTGLVFPVVERHAVLAGQFRDQHLVDDRAVDVGAAEAVVTRDRARAHAQRPVGLPAEREDRHVASPSAEVDDHRLRLVADPVEDGRTLAGDEVEEGGQRLVEQVAMA